jgi:hypothetical protein
VSAESIFLSYAAHDAAQAERLKSDLARAGVSVVDRTSFLKPGHRPKAAIKKAIGEASFFVLCLSSYEGLPPEYSKEELAAAIAAERSIVPMRFTRCDVPAEPLKDGDTTADMAVLDLYVDWSGAVTQLVQALVPKEALAQNRESSSRLRIITRKIETGQLDGDAQDITVEASEGISVTNTTRVGQPK